MNATSRIAYKFLASSLLILRRMALIWSVLILSGVALAQQSTPINYGDIWKYNQPTSDPGTTWRTVAFNDTSWASGPGLLGYETGTLPAPGIKTVVGNSVNNQPVYLFRKSFTFYGDPAGASFVIDQIVDDGVSWYLNGNPLGSVRRSLGAWNNLATSGAGDAVVELNAVSGPATGLVYGNNVLSAEVHQVSSPNSDMVFGAKFTLNSTPLTSSVWRLINFGTANNTGNAADLADGDKDGLVNLAEYALLQDPTKSSVWSSISVQGSNLTLTYQRRKSALNEVTFTTLCSTAPNGPWSTTGVTEQILADDGLIQSIQARVPLSGVSKKFFHVDVLRPLVTLPSAPSALAASATSSSQINLSWSDSTNNETGYRIERKTGSGGTYAQIATVGANVTSYQNTGLSASTNYYYRVRANNSAGDSSYSNEASATTPATLPVAPSGLGVTANSSSQISLSWTDNASNETGFKIERKTGSNGTYTQIATVGSGVTGYQNSGLTSSTNYYYRVCATNSAGDSSYSNEANTTTQLAAPSAPSGLTATVVSSNQITLSWTDNASNEAGFRIERKTGSGGFYAEIATVGAGVTTCQSTGLSASTQYDYRVCASNAVGDSPFSSEASATTQAVGATPSGPGLYAEYYSNRNCTGTPVLIRTDATINFNWGNGSPDSSVPTNEFSARWAGQVQAQFSETYTFYTNSDDGARLWVNGVLLINDLSWNGSNESSGTIALVAGQKYNLIMEYSEWDSGAFAQLSWSSSSTSKKIIPAGAFSMPSPPAAPSNLSASAISSSKINLSWSDNSNNETGFRIERKLGGGGNYSLVTTTGVGTTSFQDTGLNGVMPSSQYFYRVLAVNGGGNSTPSNEANATTQPFENPGVYRQVVNNLLFEWIPTRDVNFQIQPDGKVRIIAPLTKRSFNGQNDCQRFIYDHTHTRLSTADANALFGNGLTLPVGNHGFAILWVKAANYDEVMDRGWDLTNHPDHYQSYSQKVDYFSLSIVPVSPGTPPSSNVQEIAIPYNLQRVSWLPHYQILPYDLNLPADRGFGVTRILADIPLADVYKKVTQIQYMYGFLDEVPASRKWMCMRAYGGQTNEHLINSSVLDKNFGYFSQMDEDFGNMGEPNHVQRAQQVLEGIYRRFQNEQGVTSPVQTRLYDDYFSDFGDYSNSENFRYSFNAATMITGLSNQTMARQSTLGGHECAYFSQGAYGFRNWRQGGYLDSFERTPEGIRIYNEIYNYEKRFMAASDRKVGKMGWSNSEGVNSAMYRHGTETRLHFPDGDIIRSVEIAWPFHMMLNESFWALLLGHDYDLWESGVLLNSDIHTFSDSWAAGAGPTQWQPTGGEMANYDQSNPAHPWRGPSPAPGMFPPTPHHGDSGAFTGAWLVSQLTTVSDRISSTIEYCPFSYKLNGGAVQSGYYNSNYPTNGSLGNAKLSRYGVANYGQSNIVKTYEAKKPICLFTAGANGAALIYHNVHCGLTDVNEVTINTRIGTRTFQITGNSLHVFYLN